MPNGNLLIGHNQEKRVLQINPETGKTVSEFPIQSKTSGHDVMRIMTWTPQNTIFMGHKGDRAVREYNLQGELLKEIICPNYCQHATRLADGNVLITWKHGIKILDPSDHVLWELNQSDMPEGVELTWLIRSRQLPNGNILFSNWGAKRTDIHGMIEVNRNKEIVWKSPKGSRFNGTTSFQVIEPKQ